MKLIVEFPVMVRGVPEKTTDEKWVVFSEQVEVDIPEASSRDLTPVVKVQELKKRSNGNIMYYGTSNYVRFGSDLYWEAEAFDEHRCARFFWEGISHRNELTAGVANAISREVRSILATWTEKKRPIYPNPVASFIENEIHFSPNSGHSLRLQDRNSLKLESFDEAELARQTEAFKKHVEDFMVCDGYLYRKSIEPVLAIPRTPTSKDGGFIVTVLETCSMDMNSCFDSVLKRDLFAYFPISKSDEAIECAHELGAMQGKLDCEVFKMFDLDLYDEGFGSELADRLTLQSLAHSVSKDMYGVITDGAKSVGDIKHALVNADLRDLAVWQSLSKALAENEPEDIAASVVECLASPAGCALANRPYYEMALDRWGEREINVPSLAAPSAARTERSI
jgi:hypothetical protein